MSDGPEGEAGRPGAGRGALLSDLVRVLDDLYPPGTAQDWDAVGLVCGDPDQQVAKVLLAVDPTTEAVTEALDWGADLLLVHHPLLLRGVHGVPATTAKGRLVHRLIQSGCALFVAHTNADSASPGVSDALARVVGLGDLEPLVPQGVDERGHQLGLGRVGDLEATVTLEGFAQYVATVLPATVQGVRVAGPPDAPVRRVAVCGGAGDDLFDAVRASGADVYLTADLRHHPASEARETAAGGPPYLVDVAHWASEWPWLAGCESRLLSALAARATTVETRVSSTRTDPWTLQVPSRGGTP